MERDSTLTKAPVVFPFLIEEPKSSHQDAINQSFLSRTLTKWPHDQSSRSKDAFPPSKNVLHERERPCKGFPNTTHKETAKNYSSPNIVDLSNVIFYNDNARQNRPRRIVNGFFPNKIRSTQGSSVNDGPSRNRADQTMHSQVGMYLGRKDSASLTGVRVNNHNSNSQYLHGPGSRSSTSPFMDHLGVRRTHSSWPVRNGSPSPWLQRYKIKKRATTSYALQKPTEDEAENGTKRTPEYVNLSNAVILDAF